MALKDTLGKVDRALDRRLEDLPDVSSKADREKYRGAVKTGVGQAGRRASVTLKTLDEMGDRAVGRLRPRKGGWDRLIDYSTANPFMTILVCFIIAGAIGTQAINIPKYMRGDMEIYLPPDNEATRILTEVRADWSTDVIVIYIKAVDHDGDGRLNNLTDIESLLEMSRFEGDDTNIYAADELDRGIDPIKGDRGRDDQIVYVLSIATLIKEVNSTPARVAAMLTGADMPVGPYAIPPDQQAINTVVNTVPADTLASLLKDSDGDGIYDRAAIIVGVKAGTPPAAIVGKVDKLLKRYHPTHCRMTNTGPMTVIEKIQGRTIMEFVKIMPFLVLYLFIAMFFFHRTIKAPLIGLIPCTLALLITYGIVGFFHESMIISPQIALVAPCLIALGISYGIYITNRYTEEKKGAPVEKARVAAKAMHPAILLSAATTAIGFGSLMVGTLPPIAVMGFALSIGIMLTYVLTMILTPALTVMLKYKKQIEWGGWRRFGTVPSDHRKKTLVFFIAVLIVSAVSIMYVKFNADYLAMAPTDDPSFTNMNEYSRVMGGGQMGMVIVRGPAKDFEVLKGMENLETYMNRAPYTKCMSVVDIMKLVKVPENVTFQGVTVPVPVNVSFWDAIKAMPGDTSKTYLINMFYGALSPEMRSFLVNDDYSKTLIYIFQPMMDIELTRQAVEGVNKAVNEHPVPMSTVSRLTGVAAIQLAVNDLLIGGTLTSTGICIMLSFFVLLPVFRSWRLALFTIIPCCVVVGLEPLVLVGLNIPLSIVTVMIGSIAIGTGVDFSIQITQRVRLGGINQASVQDAVENSGISFVEATSTMVLGFMAVLISPSALVDFAMGGTPMNWFTMGVPIDSVRQFVTMIQVLLVLNAIAAIFILPAIYSVWLRWRAAEKLRREKEGWQD
jgi:predicted RND superfamily exporter protein